MRLNSNFDSIFFDLQSLSVIKLLISSTYNLIWHLANRIAIYFTISIN